MMADISRSLRYYHSICTGDKFLSFMSIGVVLLGFTNTNEGHLSCSLVAISLCQSGQFVIPPPRKSDKASLGRGVLGGITPN